LKRNHGPIEPVCRLNATDKFVRILNLGALIH
jgi:hypothetical protein